MMLSIDTNIFFAALEETAPQHVKARAFLESHREDDSMVLCELVLVELYLLLRNPAVVAKPLSAATAGVLIQTLRSNPRWRLVENAPVMDAAWDLASRDPFARRKLIDLRLALTLRHHGVTDFATVNTSDFGNAGFRRVWNPLD
jgi:toxin-antitoxin system PIN domain toxin